MSEDIDVWRAIGRAGGAQSNGMSVGTLAVRVLRDVVRVLGLDLEHAKVADIAPAVEALRARVAELEAAARWVPVGERLPNQWDVVQVWSVELHVSSAWLDDQPEWVDRAGLLDAAPTHWRPLPAGPEVQP